MSYLSKVEKGKQDQPLRVLCIGVEGVGKSQWAAGAPGAIFLPTEHGTAHLDIARLPFPQSFADVLGSLRELKTEQHEFKTIVVDGMTGMEPILAAQVCADNKWKDLEDAGYGKGFTAALDYWRQLLKALEDLWSARKMNVVLIGHTMVKPFRNPSGEDYERYQMALNEKASGLIRQWVDCVGFARHESFAKKDDRTKRVRGMSTGARVLHTTWDAAYDAKNRYGLPEEIPLSWSALEEAIAAGRHRGQALREQIADGVTALADAEVSRKVETYLKDAGDDVGRLAEIANAVAMKLSKKVETKEETRT